MKSPDFLDLDTIPEPRQEFKPTDYDASEEGYAGTAARGLVRSAARFGEGALGAYGDAQNLRKNIENTIIEKGTSYLPEQAQGLVSEALKGTVKGPVRYVQEKLIDEPFGSSDIFKQASDEISQGYTKPQGAIEKGIDEIFTMAGNLAVGNPTGAGQTFARKLFTDLGVSAVNKTAREGVKTYGGGEIAQHATGLGAMILAGFLGRADPREIARGLYQQRDARITPNTTVPVGNLFTDLMTIRNELSLGGQPSPAQAQLIGQIDTIMSKAQPGGVIPVQELTAFQVQLNSLRQNYRDINFANYQIDPIRQANQRAIADGLAHDPIALNAHREANEAYAAGAQANNMSQFVERWLPKKLQNSAVIGLLGHGIDAAKIIPGVAALGTAASALWAARIIRHVMQSPVLRREYGVLVRNISQENVPAAVNSATKLNKKLEKDKKLQKELKENDFIELDLIQ